MTQPDRAPRRPAVQMIGYDNHSPDPGLFAMRGATLTVLDRDTLLPVGTLTVNRDVEWHYDSPAHVHFGSWFGVSQHLTEDGGRIAVQLRRGAPTDEPIAGRHSRWWHDGDILAWDEDGQGWRWTDGGRIESWATWHKMRSLNLGEALRLPGDGDTIHITRADYPDALLVVRDGALHPAEHTERVRVTPVDLDRLVILPPELPAMPAGYEQRRTALRDAMLLLGEADLPGTGVTDLRALAGWLLGKPSESAGRQPRVFTSGADLPDTPGGLFRDAHGALLYAHGDNTWTWDNPDDKPWVGPPNSGELYVEVLDEIWEVPRG